MMNVSLKEWIGYVIGLASIAISITLHVRSNRRHRERLARLLDPHVIQQNLEKCRAKIESGSGSKVKRFLLPSAKTSGLHDLAVLHQTLRNVQKYVLVVRSESYTSYDTQLAEAVTLLKEGKTDDALSRLDEVIVRLSAEAKVLGE
jgi:hypothetical protein